MARRRHQGPPAQEQGIAATDIAKMLGVSRTTAYRYLNEDNA